MVNDIKVDKESIRRNDFASSDEESSLSDDKDHTDSDPESDLEWDEEFDINKLRREMISNSKLPLLEMESPDSRTTQARNILHYFLLFMLLFKAIHHVSNNALESLMDYFVQIIYHTEPTNEVLITFCVMFPSSLLAAKTLIGLTGENFYSFLVCPKCTKVYKESEIIKSRNGIQYAVLCGNIPYARGKYSKACGEPIVRRVRSVTGKTRFVPYKQYHYKSPIDSIEEILSKPGIEEECMKWKSRTDTVDELSDIYDGKVWRNFQKYNGQDFLNIPNNYGIMINVDWFQPFERRCDVSVGAIYGALMNLPRHLRFRRENILLIGIIPALQKEPESLNSFLEPLISDLNMLWKGVRLRTNQNSNGTVVRCALLCAAADIPAARKLCGFLGHSAAYGCSKCMKKFPGGFSEKTNYSGFRKSSWPPRSKTLHERYVRIVNEAQTKTQKKQLESKYGCRYSKLMDLPYFNVVDFHIIDPMHNLFLGTAKHMFKKWIELDILTPEKLALIDDNIKQLTIPQDYGRLPKNISSNYGGFTAEQWKNWTLIYSLVALKNVIPDRHYKVWHTFTQACRLIIRPTVLTSSLNIADYLFQKFGREIEELYGEDFVTPNMHLHCHLSDSIRDFGSVFGFWLFSFERYNGLLGSINTNKIDIEKQIMREFTSTDKLLGMIHQVPQKGFEKLHELLKSIFTKDFSQSISEDDIKNLHRVSSSTATFDHINWTDLSCISKPKLVKSKMLGGLQQGDKIRLQGCYQKMYPNIDISQRFPLTFMSFKAIHIGGEYYSSKMNSRGKRYSNILASWCNSAEGDIGLSGLRPGQIKRFLQHSIFINGKFQPHVFAEVKWFKESAHTTNLPTPVTSWSSNKYENDGPALFLPVQRIAGKFASVVQENSLLVMPLYRRIHI